VTFEAYPPTGPVRVPLTDTVFIGEDDNLGRHLDLGRDEHQRGDHHDGRLGRRLLVGPWRSRRW
jgi:hypothetical protein